MSRKPASLSRDISPPLTKTDAKTLKRASLGQTLTGNNKPNDCARHAQSRNPNTSLAAVESGEVEIQDHLEYFSQHLAAAALSITDGPRIGIENLRQLYLRNQHDNGSHFVVHQHDHPISGVHYDLRLQFSRTSTVSFAIPYGLPGNPNSARPNRMAIETRVHNLWNNLIESASHATGSLLIWDTGEYEILPRTSRQQPMTDDEDLGDEAVNPEDEPSESQRLIRAFQARHIRLRLHGIRLPTDYTVSLRLPSANDTGTQPKKPKHKRRRIDPASVPKYEQTSFSDDQSPPPPTAIPASVDGTMDTDTEPAAVASASDNEDEDIEKIRANNAYPGADNTIGSIHQRHWFLTLDRVNSGFRKSRSGPDAGRWVGDGWQSFIVRGRDHERSVVTGRSADEVMADEGVKKFVGRKMWRAIVE